MIEPGSMSMPQPMHVVLPEHATPLPPLSQGPASAHETVPVSTSMATSPQRPVTISEPVYRSIPEPLPLSNAVPPMPMPMPMPMPIHTPMHMPMPMPVPASVEAEPD
ncbi:hypothetical protein GGI08_008480, partial [Coemansia sp. S2]